MKTNSTVLSVGLVRDPNYGWSYAAGKLLVTSSPTKMEISTEARAFAPNVCPNLCGSAAAVQQFYADILAVDATDSRSLGLIATAAAAWWTIFAERLKVLHFQIPAVMYIGHSGGFKSSFLGKTLLLKPSYGQEKPVIYTYSRKKVDQLLEYGRYAQVIISDVRKEGAGNYGRFTLLLDEIIRPVAEEPEMPGSVLIAAETEMLKNKNMASSLMQRIIQVPMDSLDQTEDNENWLINLADRCPVGDLIFTVLPRLLIPLNDEADGYESKWEADFHAAYEDFTHAHKALGHRRELNQQFLIVRAHEEILRAAYELGLITSEENAAAWARISDVAEWFFQRQIAISTRSDGEKIRMVFEGLSHQVRFVSQRKLCSRFNTSVPTQCFDCNFFTSCSLSLDRNTCVCARPAVDIQELHLRLGELGVAIDPVHFENAPKRWDPECFLLIMRREAFLDKVEIHYEEEELRLQLPITDFKPLSFIRTLKDAGLLAYRPRDEDGNQADYAVRWGAVKILGHVYIAQPKESVLILQIPKRWALNWTEDDCVYDWQSHAPEGFEELPSVSGFKFKSTKLNKKT